jgi:hypothetical protein
MKRIRHSPEQIIRKLREADAELAKGVAVPEVCKALGTFSRPAFTGRSPWTIRVGACAIVGVIP